MLTIELWQDVYRPATKARRVYLKLTVERCADSFVQGKLALDQKEAAELFGGGVDAFSRYENGKTKPL